MKWFQTATLSLALLVTAGCATTSNNSAEWLYPPMAVPLQASVQQEVQIARLSQLLQRQDLPKEVRAKMLLFFPNPHLQASLRSHCFLVLAPEIPL